MEDQRDVLGLGGRGERGGAGLALGAERECAGGRGGVDGEAQDREAAARRGFGRGAVRALGEHDRLRAEVVEVEVEFVGRGRPG